MLDIAGVNKQLDNTIQRAIFYLRQHDPQFKHLALVTSALDTFQEMDELEHNGIDKSIEEPVKIYLHKCREALKQGAMTQSVEPQADVLYAIIELAKTLDKMRKANPALYDNIAKDEVISARLLTKLKKLIDNC
jgi:hypothetical protein